MKTFLFLKGHFFSSRKSLSRKNRCAIIFIIFFSFIYNYSQPGGKIVYKVSQKPKDTIELVKNASESSVKTKVLSFYRNAHEVNAILYFSGYESIYKVERKLDNEALNEINIVEYYAGSKNIHYVNLLSKEAFGTFYSLEKNLLVEHENNKWVLINEQKKIGDFICYKAILEDKKITAWYSLDIPLAFGPLQYHGLPGIILQLETNTAFFNAERIELNVPDIKIEKPKGKLMTQKEFKERTKNFFKE